MIARSIEKHPDLKAGKYKGLWSGYSLEVILNDGSKYKSIEMDCGVKGKSVCCDVSVDDKGSVMLFSYDKRR